MPTSPRPFRAIATALVLGVTLTGCEGGSDELLLARAAGHELTVDEAVALLAGATRIPNEPSIVETVADLWVDYTLLAEAMAEDSTLSHLDLGPLVRQQTDVEAIMALRDARITADTAVTEAELEAYYAEGGSGVEARASHILIAFPPTGPTPEQVDSARQTAEELRQRALEGEDFAHLAREHSHDSGSARRGGEIGWFARGQMVEPFEDAVFSLEEGEISEPVRTEYGFHVIKLHETRVAGIDELRDELRARIQQERTVAAESTYIADIMRGADVRPAENGFEAIRQLASRPRTELPGRAARRPVARYEGGEITVEEIRDFMLTRQPGYRVQVAEAADSVILEVVIEDLVRKELLLARAEEEGLEISGEVVDSLTRVARERFAETARQLQIASIDVQPGESPDEAIQRTVRNRLQAMLQGRREVVPVGAVGFILRRHYPSKVHRQVVVDQVVEGVARARGPGGGGAPGGVTGSGGASGSPGGPPPGGSAPSDPGGR